MIHQLRRRHPNRRMWMLLRYRWSNAGKCCPGWWSVTKIGCLRRRHPTHPEPQTGRNDLRDRHTVAGLANNETELITSISPPKPSKNLSDM
jgi:hypothetical protein